MNSNKIWRGWATNFGNGDGIIPFFSHAPVLPESYEIVLLPIADFDALCNEVGRLASYERQALHDEFSNNDTVDEWMQKHRPARVAEILERWKELQP